jgi:hypothetical protein
MEKLTRRKALLGLAAAGAGAAISGGANAQSQKESNLEAQKERLRNTLEHIEIANDRIQGAKARWTAPPTRTGLLSRRC